MKHITLLLPFILLVTSGFSVSADEPEPAEHGLVLLVDFKETGQPSNTIRVTLENRSKKPIKVIPPADIKRPWGELGWWYCGSYQFYFHSATQGVFKYICDTLPPRAIMPPPAPPKIVTLLPGQSIGTLLTLPLPVAGDAVEVRDPGDLSLPMIPNWEKIDNDRKGKAPRSGYALSVEYSPVEYQSATNFGQIGTEFNTLKLVPPAGKKITSNSLLVDVEKLKIHNK